MPTVVEELIALLGYEVKNTDDVKQFQKELDAVEKKAYKVGAAMRLGIIAAATAVSGALTLLGKGVLDTAGEFEKYETTLTTIEGSTEKAKKSLEWLADYAKTTPYEINEVTEAFVRLKAYGIDPMDGTMTAIGDTASAMGKSFLQAVEAWADAATGEFERMKEFGMKAKTQGDKVIFTWQENGKEMNKTVKKSNAEIIKFLNETMGRRFNGAMDRQSKTWGGMLSNMGDSWTAFKREIADSGFFDNVKRKLSDLMDTIERWQNDGTIKKAARELSNLFSAVADGVGIAADRIRRHVNLIVENWESIRPWALVIAGAFGILLAAIFPVTTAVGALAFALDDLLTWFEGGESVIQKFTANFGTSLLGWFAHLAQYVADAALQAGKELGNKIGQGIMEALRSWDAAIKDWVASVVPAWLRGGLSVGLPSGGMPNLNSNLSRMGSDVGSLIGRDAAARNTTNNINVNAPVNVEVREPTSAPGAVGNAIGSAIGRAAQPSRMQSGPAQ